MGTKKGSPTDKKIILVKKYPRRSISRKAETFYRSLDENNTGSQNFGHSKRIQNSILLKTFSLKNPFPANSDSGWGGIGETGAKRNPEKGSHQKSSTPSKGEFVCNLFFVKKKDRGQRPEINFEVTKWLYPILLLQNEGL